MNETNGPRAAAQPPVSLPTFSQLGLAQPVLTALTDLGFEQPTPIQAAAIPALMEGRDLLGQAQTGTGKTAAFALPLLSRLDPDERRPQVLILAPTRELALQVSAACGDFARHLPGYRAATLYGGQPYAAQLRDLSRGAQVVVGTPGRVMDHIERGTLDLSGLRAVVLDEADEMLRMGFIDDVAWILERTPKTRQVALFSATMPPAVKRIAERHLSDPVRVTIAARTATADTIRQRYCVVDGHAKAEALARLLETEDDLDAGLVFVRTKAATVELAEFLNGRGFPCEPLSGDIPQKQREQVVERLRRGRLKLLVATDVVARGLDVERITHVFNYDLPNDPESYVHRIGRTGRAGRKGEAILFVTPRERRALKGIERITRQRIEPMPLPDRDAVNARRAERFKAEVRDALAAPDLAPYQTLVAELVEEEGLDPLQLAAALARLARKNDALFVAELPTRSRPQSDEARPRTPRRPDVPMARYRLAVGRRHGVRPGNIVGAIANEARLESRHIGRIEIHDDHSLVDLPRGMDSDRLATLSRARVAGRPLDIRPAERAPSSRPRLGVPRD